MKWYHWLGFATVVGGVGYLGYRWYKSQQWTDIPYPGYQSLDTPAVFTVVMKPGRPVTASSFANTYGVTLIGSDTTSPSMESVISMQVQSIRLQTTIGRYIDVSKAILTHPNVDNIVMSDSLKQALVIK